MFLASQKLHGVDEEDFTRVVGIFEQTHVGTRLISVASMTRNLLEFEPTDHLSKEKVGTLLEDKANPASAVSLTLREACNKILHADEYTNLELGKPLPMMLCLSGVKHGKRPPEAWEARLEVMLFIRAALRAARVA